MKKLIATSFLFLSISLIAQQTPNDINLQLSPIRSLLYAGIKNSFELNSELTSDKWEVTSSNGSCKKWGRNQIWIIPDSVGTDTIKVFYIENDQKKLIIQQTLNVVSLPQPELKISSNNKISIEELNQLTSFNIISGLKAYRLKYSIKSGVITTISKDGKKTKLKVKEDVISKKVKEAFLKLKKGDIILFHDFVVYREKSEMKENVKGNFLIID